MILSHVRMIELRGGAEVGGYDEIGDYRDRTIVGEIVASHLSEAAAAAVASAARATSPARVGAEVSRTAGSAYARGVSK